MVGLRILTRTGFSFGMCPFWALAIFVYSLTAPKGAVFLLYFSLQNIVFGPTSILFSILLKFGSKMELFIFFVKSADKIAKEEEINHFFLIKLELVM